MNKSWNVLFLLMNVTHWMKSNSSKFIPVSTSALICQYSSLWMSWQAASCKSPNHYTNPSFVRTLICLSLASSFISISSTPNMKPYSWRQGTERKNCSSGKTLKCLTSVACLEITQGTTQFSCLSLSYEKKAVFFFFVFVFKNHIFTKPIKFKTRLSKFIKLKWALMRGFSNP